MQAVRHFGGTFGVALTVAFLGTSAGLAALVAYDRIWWTVVIGGIATVVAALPMHTNRPHARSQPLPDAAPELVA